MNWRCHGSWKQFITHLPPAIHDSTHRRLSFFSSYEKYLLTLFLPFSGSCFSIILYPVAPARQILCQGKGQGGGRKCSDRLDQTTQIPGLGYSCSSMAGAGSMLCTTDIVQLSQSLDTNSFSADPPLHSPYAFNCCFFSLLSSRRFDGSIRCTSSD